MAEKKAHKSGSQGGTIIQLNLVGVVIFSLALVAASVLVTYGLLKNRSGESPKAVSVSTSTNLDSLDVEETNQPSSGQLVVREIELEQPEEYVAYETTTNRAETWTFENMTPEEVRAAMQSSGVAEDEIQRALSSPMMSSENGNVVVTPDDGLIFSLDPQTRSKLYNVLARFNENEFMRFPFVFRTNTFEERFGDGKLKNETFASLKKLVYRRGDIDCFSDLDVLLKNISDDDERLRFVKALSRQNALLVGIRVWPDTDIDKIIQYWSRPTGVRLIDTRPLLESLQRHPGGGAAGILYFLPPFARERLYTYPLPSKLGDPAIDCHWSTMNFFNETPDNRFSDVKFIGAYISTNYYQIAKPTAYGDIILLMDDKNEAIHSAVYLADDIVFTKNGNNFAQPWMLMRLKDLEAEYTTDVAPRVVVYRNKNW
jgi:hypothetical protein